MLKGFTRNFKPLEILTEEQIEAIHRGTLEILWETGVTFESEKALKLLKRNGCEVNFDKRRAHFPPDLVEWAIGRVPSGFHLKARDPNNNMMIGGNTLYFIGGCGLSAIDLDTYEPRPATRKENYDAVKVLDALNNFHLHACYSPYYTLEGIPPVMLDMESTAARIRNSAKCEWAAAFAGTEVFSARLFKAVGADAIGQFLVSPPLTYYEDAINAVFTWIDAGFPYNIGSGDVFGGTAPATLAGAIVHYDAEILAGVVLGQVIKPGSKVLVDQYAFPLDMKTGSPRFGAVGCALHGAVFGQMARHYELPFSTCGGGTVSSSKQIDYQSGYEKMMAAFSGAISGGNLAWIHGNMYGEVSWHPYMAILDDDLAGMIGHFIEGVEVSEETLAIDLIEQVGPIPGSYLNKEHTRKWWKLEQFVPKCTDSLTYPQWIKEGKKSCLDYAKERMEDILATHKPTALTASQEEDIERILGEARKYYREKGMISDAEWAEYMREVESPNYPYE